MISVASSDSESSASQPCEAETGSFSELVARLAPATHVVRKRDKPLLGKLYIIAKTFMEQQVRNLCVQAGSRPAMLIYGSDLTPMLMACRASVKSNGQMVVREGGRATEWCVHRFFIFAFDDMGDLQCRTVYEAPVAMQCKRSWHLYAVACRLMPLLTQLHPEGISMSWYVFDRGASGPMGRLFRMRHKQRIELLPADEQVMAYLMDWHFKSDCADHTVQSGPCKGCALDLDTKTLF